MREKKLNSASFDAQYFRILLMTKFLVIFIFLTLVVQRLVVFLTNIVTRSDVCFYVALSLSLVLIFIIIAKYMIYRRIGSRIFKYTKLFDLAFTLVFVSEWVFVLRDQFIKSHPGDYRYGLATIVSLLAFSWRTLIQVLLAQHWIFKIIPTTCAYGYVLSFAVVHQPTMTGYILLVGLFQVFYVILIFYFDHRVQFRLLMGNLQQEQWLQMNEFILNSIPENIVIMDLNGNCKFISEHFKKLMMLRNQSLETKEFFSKVKNLQRQPNSEDASGAKETTPGFVALEMPSSPEIKSNSSSSAKQDTVAGDSLEDLIHIFRNSIAKDMIKDKSLHVFNGKFKEDNQEERSFEISISFLNQFSKHILLILRDTTDRDLVLTLQGNIKYKDHLLDTVSHELRAPLNGNINLLQAAIKSNDKSDQIKGNLLEPALKCSTFLLHTINDLLDMSQIKANKLRLVFQQSNIKETLVNSVHLLEFYAKKKSLALETEIDKDIPELFCTDHQRLSQIVVNLMNNAIRTIHKGFIRLLVRPLKDSNQLQICIEDSGIGMTEETIKILFKDFIQIENKNREDPNPASFATGLKMTNDLVKLLGPKEKKGIAVHSIRNQGSKFSFVIENKEIGLLLSQNKTESEEIYKDEPSPVVPTENNPETDISLALKLDRNISNATQARLTRAEIPQSLDLHFSCSCAQVLVVDDDPFNIMAYEIILNSISVKYECVYSGKNAIEKMLSKVRYPCSSQCHPYKVVFMDEEMPEMTGTQTVAEIQSLQQQDLLPQMSIIGCSAHHEGEEIERFLKSGIAEYIPKPISKHIIKKMIDKYGF